MNNTQSLNKIKDIFYSVSMGNKMVNEFGFGPTYNLNTAVQRKYPLVWVEPATSAASRSGNTGQGRIQVFNYSFNIYVLDRIMKGEDNYDEILSNCQFILQSLIVSLDQHPYYTDMGINTEGDIRWDPVFEVEDDNVNGWMATITLRVPNRLTPCSTPQIPILSWTSSLGQNSVEYRLIGPQGPTGPQGPAGTGSVTSEYFNLDGGSPFNNYPVRTFRIDFGGVN
jgi:hypothetical protein